LPRKWLRVPNGTPPQLEPFVDDPLGLVEFVEGVLRKVREERNEEAELLDVYFEVGRPVAHVLVRGLDDPITLKAVCRILGAEGVTELITVEQFTDAIRRDRGIRGGPEPDSTSSPS
jgi:hypothetical protein